MIYQMVSFLTRDAMHKCGLYKSVCTSGVHLDKISLLHIVALLFSQRQRPSLIFFGHNTLHYTVLVVDAQSMFTFD